jgi:hypothetical protein
MNILLLNIKTTKNPLNSGDALLSYFFTKYYLLKKCTFKNVDMLKW